MRRLAIARPTPVPPPPAPPPATYCAALDGRSAQRKAPVAIDRTLQIEACLPLHSPRRARSVEGGPETKAQRETNRVERLADTLSITKKN